MRPFVVLVLLLLAGLSLPAQLSIKLKKTIPLKESNAWNVKEVGLWRGMFAGTCYNEFFMWDKKGRVFRKANPIVVLNYQSNDSLVRLPFKNSFPKITFTINLIVGTNEYCFILDETQTTRLGSRFKNQGNGWGGFRFLTTEQGQASGSRLLVPLRPDGDGQCKAAYDTTKPHNDAELYDRLRRELLDRCLADTTLPLFAFVPYKLPLYDTVPEHNFLLEGLQDTRFIGKQDPAFARYAAQGKYSLAMPEWWSIEWPFDYDTTHQLVYVNQNITPNIYQYDTSGRLLKTFGEPGRHLTEHEREVYFMTPSRVDTFVSWAMADSSALGFRRKQQSANWNAQYCMEWLSRQYQEILYDEPNNRIFRIYRKPLPDLTLKTAKPFFGACNPKIWQSPYGKRPTYLQIYDMNAGGKLIHDEMLYHQDIHLMGVDADNVLWGSAFAKDGEYVGGPMKVLQFQIKE